jgi:vancomycin aglycone glucosyltransferase
MRGLLSTYDSRGGVEPLVGLAVRLRELGAEVQMSAALSAALTPQTRGPGGRRGPQDLHRRATVAATLLLDAVSRTLATRS